MAKYQAYWKLVFNHFAPCFLLYFFNRTLREGTHVTQNEGRPRQGHGHFESVGKECSQGASLPLKQYCRTPHDRCPQQWGQTPRMWVGVRGVAAIANDQEGVLLGLAQIEYYVYIYIYIYIYLFNVHIYIYIYIYI